MEVLVPPPHHVPAQPTHPRQLDQPLRQLPLVRPKALALPAFEEPFSCQLFFRSPVQIGVWSLIGSKQGSLGEVVSDVLQLRRQVALLAALLAWASKRGPVKRHTYVESVRGSPERREAISDCTEP